MQLLLGNPGNGPDGSDTVTYVTLPSAEEWGDVETHPDVTAVKAHVLEKSIRGMGVVNLQQKFGVDLKHYLAITNPVMGLWAAHNPAGNDPTFVSSDNPELTELVGMLGTHWGIPTVTPVDIENAYWTKFGAPGVQAPTPSVADVGDLEALLVNQGRDAFVQASFSYSGLAGSSGTSTSGTATTLTNTGASWTTNQWAGFQLVNATKGTFGLILSNTGTALTVDRMSAIATPGGAAGSANTTGGGDIYLICIGGLPWAIFAGITTNSTAAGATDTSLTSEITTASGGLIRQICTVAHSAGTTTTTLTNVFTVNSNDTGLPVTIAKIGYFRSMVVAANQLTYEDVFGTTAVLSAIGDALTTTNTITGT